MKLRLPSRIRDHYRKDLIRKQSHRVEGGNDLREIAKKIVAAFNHDQLDLLRKK